MSGTASLQKKKKRLEHIIPMRNMFDTMMMPILEWPRMLMEMLLKMSLVLQRVTSPKKFQEQGSGRYAQDCQMNGRRRQHIGYGIEMSPKRVMFIPIDPG